jgi:outer membrane protein OmpA-like peptidoglycan-associated protein
MKEARFRYFKGRLTSQFQTEAMKDRHGVRTAGIILQPRHYLSDAREVTEEEYNRAVAGRLSGGALAWQRRFLQPGGEETGPALPVGPHILQKGETLVEFEPSGADSYAEVVDEIFAEFPEGNPAEPYRGWQFTAEKDRKYHGRITGQGWCRVPEIDPEEKKQKLATIGRKQNLSQAAAGGCLPAIGRAVPAGGCNPISLFAGGGCLSGGCSQMGCGLLSLLGLLALLFSLFRSCSEESSQKVAPRVVHDTVYVREGNQVREFEDSAGLANAEVILLPNVQFYTNSARLLPYSIRPIQELAVFLDAHPELNAIIKGHTDDVGEEAANRKLSQERAESVRAVLISLGIAPERIKAIGYGESAPKVRGQTVEARALNRRVEVELVAAGESQTGSSPQTRSKP